MSVRAGMIVLHRKIQYAASHRELHCRLCEKRLGGDIAIRGPRLGACVLSRGHYLS